MSRTNGNPMFYILLVFGVVLAVFYQTCHYFAKYKSRRSDMRKIGIRYRGWALITGTSSGLGRKAAIALAKEGFDGIVLHASQKSQLALEELSETITRISEGKVKTRIVLSDFSKAEQVNHLLESIADIKVSLLINNAGFGANGQFDKLDVQLQLDMIAVNCSALLRLTHAMVARRRVVSAEYTNKFQLAIVNISSLAGALPGIPWLSTYAATKAFVSSLTHGISYSLREEGVRVILIEPGTIEDTKFQATARQFCHAGPNTADDVVDQIIRILRSNDKQHYHVVTSFQDSLVWWASKLLPIWLMNQMAAKRGKLYSPAELR